METAVSKTVIGQQSDNREELNSDPLGCLEVSFNPARSQL